MKKRLFLLLAANVFLFALVPALAQEHSGKILPADDSGLTLLIDYCKKTLSTVGGDGYSEIVLYKNEATGTYQLHTYRLYEGMEAEEHHAYWAEKAAADAAFALIDQLKLTEYEGDRGFGLCGAEYVVRFLQGDRIIRISTDNLGDDGAGMLASIGNLLYEALPIRNN